MKLLFLSFFCLTGPSKYFLSNPLEFQLRGMNNFSNETIAYLFSSVADPGLSLLPNPYLIHPGSWIQGQKDSGSRI